MAHAYATGSQYAGQAKVAGHHEMRVGTGAANNGKHAGMPTHEKQRGKAREYRLSSVSNRHGKASTSPGQLGHTGCACVRVRV